MGLIGTYAIFSFLALCYALISVLMIIGVSRLRKAIAKNIDFGTNSEARLAGELPFVSILVSARNEEECIASCLESLLRQQYPSDKYEIVVVNDRSTDKTPTIVKRFQKKHRIIKHINIDSNPSGLTGKQNALNEGLKLCAGEIILNTDADCIVGPLWTRRTVSHFTPQIDLTIGFCTTYSLDGSASLFSDLQFLDMLFLVDSAAGAIGVNVPVSGLGRNLAYRKTVLDDTGYREMGYTITEDAALIQAVAKNTHHGIGVVYDRDAAVLTSSEKNMKQFLSQRIRWIRGGQATRSWTQIPLYAIFLFHLCLAIFFPLMFFVRSLVTFTLSFALIKVVLDFIRCWRVCQEFKRTDLLRLFMLYEVFMVFYSILTGFGSFFVRVVRWKGESYTVNTRHMNGI